MRPSASDSSSGLVAKGGKYLLPGVSCEATDSSNVESDMGWKRILCGRGGPLLDQIPEVIHHYGRTLVALALVARLDEVSFKVGEHKVRDTAAGVLELFFEFFDFG